MNLPGANQPAYTVVNAQAANGGPNCAYQCSIYNSASGLLSNEVTLTVNPASPKQLPPTIVLEPINHSVSYGGTVLFTVAGSFEAVAVPVTVAGTAGPAPRAQAAVSDAGPTYQWFLNGVPIAGATGPTYLLSDASPNNSGSYTCLLTNDVGSVLSTPATLNVVGSADPGRLVNLSCRALVGTGDDVAIVGFTVGGTGTIGAQDLLVRASGPALTAYGVSPVLPDPSLQLHNAGGVLAMDTGWAGNTRIAATAAAVGAFAWSNGTSADSALLASLAGGAYTAVVSGASGDTGVGLLEVYDATADGQYSGATPRLRNLSGRIKVGTGGNILIAGFTIGGDTAGTVLIRASGPALAAFGVTDVLADPQLQLVHTASDGTATVLQTDTGWGADATIASEATAVGAFSWGTAATPDSAILVTLDPGSYTAEVSGASGDTGVALVEIYEVP